jgi:ornithine cyclodeaminase
MSVRVIDEHDVRSLLPMDECIEVMAEALAALARGEVHNPLRFVVRPPDAPSLMGLMPAYRGGEVPLWGLKSVVIAPANAERGLDLHQGFVALFDGETGETRAILNAGGITAVRTAAVTAVATRLLARANATTLAILGAGIQGKANLEAMRAVRDFDRVLAWSRTPGRAAAELNGVEEVATVEEAVRDADVVVTATSAPEPILRREWLKAGVHVNAVGSSIPTTRELDTQTMADAALFVDRRESTVNEAGDFLFPQREGAIGPDHIRGEIGELLIGAAEGRRSDDELTVFKSLGLAVEDLAAAEHVLRRAEAENVGTVVSVCSRSRRSAVRARCSKAPRSAHHSFAWTPTPTLRSGSSSSSCNRCARSRSAAPATRFSRRPTRNSPVGCSRRAQGTWRRELPTRHVCVACPRRSLYRSMRPRRRSMRSSATAGA